VSRQDLDALQSIPIPDLNRVISKPGYNLLIVVLQTVDALRVLAAAIDSLKIEPAHSPVVLYTFDVFDDFRVERPVEIMIWMALARSRFEEILYPESKLKDE